MHRYQWTNARSNVESSRLIELLNEHFRRVTNLFGGLIRLDAGYRFSQFVELPLLTSEPDAPSEGVRLYTVTAGGKTTLKARFPTGASQVISTEP